MGDQNQNPRVPIYWNPHVPIKPKQPDGSSIKGVLDFGPTQQRVTCHIKNRMPMPRPDPQQPLLPIPLPLPHPVVVVVVPPLPEPEQEPPEPEHLEQEPPEPEHLEQEPPEPEHLEQEPPEPEHLEQEPPEPEHLEQEPPEPEHLEQVPPEPAPAAPGPALFPSDGDCHLPRSPSPREAPSGSGLVEGSCSDMEISEDDADDPSAEGATQRQVRTIYLSYSEISRRKKDSGTGDDPLAEGVTERQVRWTWHDPAASHLSSSNRVPPALVGGGVQEARAYSSPYEVFDFQTQASLRLTFREDNTTVLGADAGDESLEFSDSADDD